MARPKNSSFPVKTLRRRKYHPVKLDTGGWTIPSPVSAKKTPSLPACNQLTALLFAFKHADNPEAKEYLFWEIAEVIWGTTGEDAKFAKHKWSWQIIHECCRERYLALGGAANVGKSYVCAGWGIVNWLSDPANTIVLMTSTDREGAKKRIWGCMKDLLDLVPDPPCKNSFSIGAVCYSDGVNKPSSKAGIFLVTADKSKSKDKVGKLIGIHAPRVFLIADELSDISENVQTAATGNLAKNPFFQMIGLSNPSSRFDPFGVFSTPEHGWDSVNPEIDYEWRTNIRGKFIRIDSELSPNMDTEFSDEYEGGVIYPFLPTEESIQEDLATFGNNPEEARKSRNYMRFNRAIFFDSDDADTIYSYAELMRAGALRGNEEKVLQGKVLVAGFDPSFSSAGDNSVLTFVELGYVDSTQMCINHKEIVYIYEDATNKVDPRNVQIAEKVKAECIKRGLDVVNLGIDASGAGSVFCDMLQLVWKPGFLRVQFGGAASDKRIKNDSKITGKDRYKNRASELFFIGQQFLLGRQIYGIPPKVAEQMCNRQYITSKGLHGIVLQVEPKGLYKSRVGYSPDETDSFLVAVETARTRQLFIPADPVAKKHGEDELSRYLQARRTTATYAADKMGFVGNL